MKEKFPEKIDCMSNPILVMKLAKALGHVNSADPDFERGMPSYTVGDIFKYLPHSISYNGHRGDLSVSTVDIAYFSVGADWKHIIVHFEPIPIGGSIYDAFYNMVIWLKENNLLNVNE